MAFRPIRALFLGPPGAGKGTLTGRLCRDIPNLITISSGDVLREQIRAKTPLGLEAETYIKNGKLLPDATMVSLISSVMEADNLLTPKSSWILDGFPRTYPQAPPLDKELAKVGADLNLVVRLDVPEDCILDRIANRWIHPGSGRVYNLTFNPPKVPGKDDVTGEPLVQRLDDNPEVVKKRIRSYVEQTLPLLDYYREKGILAEFAGRSSDELYPRIFSFVKSKFSVDTQASQKA